MTYSEVTRKFQEAGELLEECGIDSTPLQFILMVMLQQGLCYEDAFLAYCEWGNFPPMEVEAECLEDMEENTDFEDPGELLTFLAEEAKGHED